ncbi:hypothetical protein [Paractinoplanes globisporus]|uniref:Uncharacterized protein n=1 Tax=Paractinoplanes globisporus TaxID=113565 RepID=A0ABW6WMW9_9ACTN|nr:hypothetical protein [Actinoplanes globisporus]
MSVLLISVPIRNLRRIGYLTGVLPGVLEESLESALDRGLERTVTSATGSLVR